MYTVHFLHWTCTWTSNFHNDIAGILRAHQRVKECKEAGTAGAVIIAIFSVPSSDGAGADRIMRRGEIHSSVSHAGRSLYRSSDACEWSNRHRFINQRPPPAARAATRVFTASARQAAPPSEIGQRHPADFSSALCRGYNTTIRLRIRPPFDSHSTAVRPRYDRSTTCVTVVGLTVVGCCTAA